MTRKKDVPTPEQMRKAVNVEPLSQQQGMTESQRTQLLEGHPIRRNTLRQPPSLGHEQHEMDAAEYCYRKQHHGGKYILLKAFFSYVFINIPDGTTVLLPRAQWDNCYSKYCFATAHDQYPVIADFQKQNTDTQPLTVEQEQ